MFATLKVICARCAAPMLGIAILAAALATGGATSPASATAILFSRAGVTAIQGANTPVFSMTDSGTNFASAVEISGDYQASAIAQTGTRSNSATASARKTTTSGFSSAGAKSSWTDGLTFAGGTGRAMMTFVFSLSGSLSDASATASFEFVFDEGDDTCCSDSFSESFTGPGGAGMTALYDVEFTYGTSDPIIIQAVLQVSSAVSRDITGTSTANFSATAILTEVIVPDGTTITSESGTNYLEVLVVPTDIPEPGTLAILVIGLAGLGFARRKPAA